MEDQAVVGWGDGVWSEGAVEAVYTFYDLLANGYDVDSARMDAALAYRTWAHSSELQVIEQLDHLLHVIGDFFTRMHYVYTGDPDEDWTDQWVIK